MGMTSPLLAEYSGAKSFIEMFSRSLKAELAPYKIHVQVQAPLFVATKMAKIRKTSLTVPSPQSYARSAVAHIGYEAPCRLIGPTHYSCGLSGSFLSGPPLPSSPTCTRGSG